MNLCGGCDLTARTGRAETGHRWWRDLSKEAAANEIADAAGTYWDWVASHNGERQDPRLGVPEVQKEEPPRLNVPDRDRNDLSHKPPPHATPTVGCHQAGRERPPPGSSRRQRRRLRRGILERAEMPMMHSRAAATIVGMAASSRRAVLRVLRAAPAAGPAALGRDAEREREALRSVSLRGRCAAAAAAGAASTNPAHRAAAVAHRACPPTVLATAGQRLSARACDCRFRRGGLGGTKRRPPRRYPPAAWHASQPIPTLRCATSPRRRPQRRGRCCWGC